MRTLRPLALIALSLCFYPHKIICNRENKSAAAQAITSILVDYLAKVSWTVDIIYFGKKSGISENLVESVIKHGVEPSVIQVYKGGNSPWKIKLNHSSILAFDSLRNLRDAANNIIWSSDPRVRAQHLVSVPNITFDDFKTIKIHPNLSSVWTFSWTRTINRSCWCIITCTLQQRANGVKWTFSTFFENQGCSGITRISTRTCTETWMDAHSLC